MFAFIFSKFNKIWLKIHIFACDLNEHAKKIIFLEKKLVTKSFFHIIRLTCLRHADLAQ